MRAIGWMRTMIYRHFRVGWGSWIDVYIGGVNRIADCGAASMAVKEKVVDGPQQRRHQRQRRWMWWGCGKCGEGHCGGGKATATMSVISSCLCCSPPLCSFCRNLALDEKAQWALRWRWSRW
jgi:hypothetical protein